jgi:MYXO-CTERM domain-containing protein
MDVAASDRGATDGPPEVAATDAGGDAPADRGGTGGAAGDGASVEPAADAGRDAAGDGLDSTVVPGVHARGGACSCSASDAPWAPGWLILALAAACARARRRRPS